MNLSELLLNDGLQKICWNAFQNCKSLKSISVPSTVTIIRSCAFKGCESLPQEIILHEGMGKIEENVFEDCQSVEVFRFPLLSKCLVAIAGKWADLNNKVDEVRSVVQWEDGELFVPPAAMNCGNNWGSIKTILCKIEMLSSLALLELALWKCRIDVPGPVKDVILEYLYPQSNQE